MHVGPSVAGAPWADRRAVPIPNVGTRTEPVLKQVPSPEGCGLRRSFNPRLADRNGDGLLRRGRRRREQVNAPQHRHTPRTRLHARSHCAPGGPHGAPTGCDFNADGKERPAAGSRWLYRHSVHHRARAEPAELRQGDIHRAGSNMCRPAEHGDPGPQRWLTTGTATIRHRQGDVAASCGTTRTPAPHRRPACRGCACAHGRHTSRRRIDPNTPVIYSLSCRAPGGIRLCGLTATADNLEPATR